MEENSSTIVLANSYSMGKAVIPSYEVAPTCATHFYVSNITDFPINVIMTLYKEDGSLLTDDNNISKGVIVGSGQLLNYCDKNTDSTVTFTLNAHCTGEVSVMYPNPLQRGYGVIQWNQDGNALQGLVAWGHMAFYKSSEESRAAIEINGGLPF